MGVGDQSNDGAKHLLIVIILFIAAGLSLIKPKLG